VPTINVSMVDLSFVGQEGRPRSTRCNKAVKQACDSDLKGILEYTAEPLVSSDFNHNPPARSSSLAHQGVRGTLVKVCSWYDNEWGFSNRMLDVPARSRR
jgi:glyceraldehyde 3-phosphate dehydrogenase